MAKQLLGEKSHEREATKDDSQLFILPGQGDANENLSAAEQGALQNQRPFSTNARLKKDNQIKFKISKDLEKEVKAEQAKQAKLNEHRANTRKATFVTEMQSQNKNWPDQEKLYPDVKPQFAPEDDHIFRERLAHGETGKVAQIVDDRTVKKQRERIFASVVFQFIIALVAVAQFFITDNLIRQICWFAIIICAVGAIASIAKRDKNSRLFFQEILDANQRVFLYTSIFPFLTIKFVLASAISDAVTIVFPGSDAILAALGYGLGVLLHVGFLEQNGIRIDYHFRNVDFLCTLLASFYLMFILPAATGGNEILALASGLHSFLIFSCVVFFLDNFIVQLAKEPF